MGIGPRLFGLDKLAVTMPIIQYILFWDDDNQFFPDALANIDQAIQESGNPDLLLVPIKHKWRSLPSRGVPLRALPMGNVDTANLCVKTEAATKHFARSQHPSDVYHHDFYFYRSICDDASTKVCLANIDNIGRYDGLRFWETIRWKICPRSLQIYDTTFMRRLRRLMPRG
jgi:glycosyltransferase involved in cell wall biosynthesis